LHYYPLAAKIKDSSGLLPVHHTTNLQNNRERLEMIAILADAHPLGLFDVNTKTGMLPMKSREMRDNPTLFASVLEKENVEFFRKGMLQAIKTQNHEKRHLELFVSGMFYDKFLPANKIFSNKWMNLLAVVAISIAVTCISTKYLSSSRYSLMFQAGFCWVFFIKSYSRHIDSNSPTANSKFTNTPVTLFVVSIMVANSSRSRLFLHFMTLFFAVSDCLQKDIRLRFKLLAEWVFVDLQMSKKQVRDYSEVYFSLRSGSREKWVQLVDKFAMESKLRVMFGLEENRRREQGGVLYWAKNGMRIKDGSELRAEARKRAREKVNKTSSKAVQSSSSSKSKSKIKITSNAPVKQQKNRSSFRKSSFGDPPEVNPRL